MVVLVGCSPPSTPSFAPPAPVASSWVKEHLPRVDVRYTGPSSGPGTSHWDWWEVTRPFTWHSSLGRVLLHKNWTVGVALGPGPRSSRVEGVFYATQRHPMTFHPLIASSSP